MSISAVTARSNYTYALIMASQALACANAAQREVVHARQILSTAERTDLVKGTQVDIRA